MLSDIILTTVLVPFLLGCGLFIAAQTLPKFGFLGGLLTGAALFGIYVLLEGWPSIPPISSKPKVALMIVGATVLTMANMAVRLNRFVLVVGLLGFALFWIGWSRVGDTTMQPRFAALAVLILAGGWSFQSFKHPDNPGLFWPVTLIAFAIGGALISLLGAYIGLAQAMGAMAAFLGGFAFLTYALLLLRPNKTARVLPQNLYQVAFLSLMSVLIAIGLFAPEVSPVALAMLALVLLMPKISSWFLQLPSVWQPVIYGLATIIPVGVAAAIAAY